MKQSKIKKKCNALEPAAGPASRSTFEYIELEWETGELPDDGSMYLGIVTVTVPGRGIVFMEELTFDSRSMLDWMGELGADGYELVAVVPVEYALVPVSGFENTRKIMREKRLFKRATEVVPGR